MARRRYSPEFKADAVKFVMESNRTVADIARHLDIQPMTLGNWVRKENSRAGGVSAAGVPDETPEQELHRLRVERKEWVAKTSRLELELDFAKKVASWLAKNEK
jgi:transposase